MTEKEIRKIIKHEIAEQTKEITRISDTKNTFKKVEKMLSFYRSFQRRIEKLEESMDQVVLKKCCGIPGDFGNSSYEFKSDLEKIEDIQERNRKMIARMQHVVDLTEFGIEEIKNDKHYKIIEMKYFERLSMEDIAEKLDVSVITAKRNKSRLINELTLIMFPDEIIENF